jgi:hypothetical protein
MNVYWYALVGVILFFVLSPGVLVTLPPVKGCGMWMQTTNGNGGCGSSITAVAVHALVFVVLFAGFTFYAQHKL